MSDNRMERKQIYSQFVNTKSMSSYVEIMKKITKIVDRLIGNNLIDSDAVKLLCRIKGFNSANNNDQKKALDDIFGGKINAASMEDLCKIIEEILDSSGLTIQQIKVSGSGTDEKMRSLYDGYAKKGYKTIYKKREDGYEAVLLMLYDKKDENCPLIELQFRTSAMEKRCTVGDLAHDKWKKEESSCEILKMISNGIMPDLPLIAFCWQPNWPLRRISKIEELLITFYPALDVKKVRKALAKSAGMFELEFK